MAFQHCAHLRRFARPFRGVHRPPHPRCPTCRYSNTAPPLLARGPFPSSSSSPPSTPTPAARGSTPPRGGGGGGGGGGDDDDEGNFFATTHRRGDDGGDDGDDDDDDDRESNLFATTYRRARGDDDDDDDDDEGVLSSFANLDHGRARRAGFPEAVFGQGKTPSQVHAILDDMARSARRDRRRGEDGDVDGEGVGRSRAGPGAVILATRVDREAYDALDSIGPLSTPGASMEYHGAARIVSVRLGGADDDDDGDNEYFGDSLPPTPTPTSSSWSSPPRRQSVVVACAGTTDLPVAEEAAVTLELSGVRVDRVYDCGVAGLHRILRALPRLRHPDVGCVIVCAGMDGALPSVVGGLVDVPVVAVPTSVGYGASLGGVSALLTMLNSCSPGVGVVNIDNGFGGAVLAMKCLNSRRGGG
jgi:NCAIR mutase (PurE)-related protein